MFSPKDRVGHIACPFCAAIGRPDVRLAMQINSKANQNLYIVCDGRADPHGRGCNTRIYVGADPSDHFKDQAATAAPGQKEESDVAENQPATIPAGQPEPEPEPGTADDAETGEPGDTGGDERPLGYC